MSDRSIYLDAGQVVTASVEVTADLASHGVSVSFAPIGVSVEVYPATGIVTGSENPMVSSIEVLSLIPEWNNKYKVIISAVSDVSQMIYIEFLGIDGSYIENYSVAIKGTV